MANATAALFPPATFAPGSLTDTRVGGLLYVGVVLCSLLVICAVPACRAVRGSCLPRRRACPWSFLQPLFFGLMMGLWLHFVPCIVWCAVKCSEPRPPLLSVASPWQDLRLEQQRWCGRPRRHLVHLVGRHRRGGVCKSACRRAFDCLWC